MHGLDKPRSPSLITKRFAQLTHADHEHGVAHGGFRPEYLEKRLFGHQLLGMHYEIAQGGEGLWSEMDLLRPAPQLLIGDIHMKWWKLDERGLPHAAPFLTNLQKNERKIAGKF